MKQINWANYNWITQERWGQIHPDKPIVWYDESAVVLNDDNSIDLLSHWNPKKFRNLLGNSDFFSDIGVGLISCTEKFEYGYFELTAKLPTQAFAWPAFWMWSWDKWPPEIDVFEGYANRKGKYWSSFWDILENRFWKVESNVHLGKTPNNYNIGAHNHFLGYKSPSVVWNKYAVLWLPEEISFWYNDTLVRKIKERSILDQLKGTTMNVVINNSVYKTHPSHKKDVGVFSIKDFTYTMY